MRHIQVRPDPSRRTIDDRWISELSNDLSCFSLSTEGAEAVEQCGDLAHMGLVPDVLPAPPFRPRHYLIGW